MRMSEELNAAIERLRGLSKDDFIPRNVRSKLEEIIQVLSSDQALSIRVNKALSDIEEISEDANIQPFTRTEIIGIASMLESIDTE